MTKNTKRNAGFTLVELSIVLVIIGLIIGGVLSGRQIMLNAQITNAVNAIQGFEAQFQTYTQNYGAMPGNDANALVHFPNSSLPSTVGSGNGTLAGSFDASPSQNSESVLLWADLRAAGLVKGAVSATQPTNPFGGIYGFQHGAFGSAFTTNVICLNSVPGDAAQAIDSRLDDGSSNGGAVQAMVSTDTVGEAVSGTVATSYNTSLTYTTCVKM